MNAHTVANIRAAALAAAMLEDIDDLDPETIDQLAEDGAWDWREIYGSEGAFLYADAFCAAALERIGL